MNSDVYQDFLNSDRKFCGSVIALAEELQGTFETSIPEINDAYIDLLQWALKYMAWIEIREQLIKMNKEAQGACFSDREAVKKYLPFCHLRSANFSPKSLFLLKLKKQPVFSKLKAEKPFSFE